MLTEAEEGQMELSDLMGMQDIVWLGKCLQHQFPGDLPHCLAGIDLWELVQVVHSQDAPLASPCPARCFKKAKPDVGLPQVQGPTTPESFAASMPKGWEVKFGFDFASFTMILSRVKAALFWLRTDECDYAYYKQSIADNCWLLNIHRPMFQFGPKVLRE